jgi:hypothetical protein
MKALSVTLLKRRYSGNIDPEYAYRKPPALKNLGRIFTVSNEGWTLDNIDQSREKGISGRVFLFTFRTTARYDT